MIHFEVLDAVDVKITGITQAELKLLRKQTSWKATAFIQGQFKKKRKEWDKSLIWGTLKEHGGYFLPAGFFQRVLNYCDKEGIAYEVEDPFNSQKLEEKPGKPHLPGIVFREDQERLIASALAKQRGVLMAPTGTGKTLLMLGILSAFKKSKALILVHTLDILNQTMEELRRFGFDPSQVGDGETKLRGRIAVATRPGMTDTDNTRRDKNNKGMPVLRENHKAWMRDVDIILIDECFAAGTQITTPSGQQRIELLRQGDLIVTSRGEQHVQHTFRNRVQLDRLAKVTLDNGTILFCSKEHEFMTELGWTPAADSCGLTTIGNRHRSRWQRAQDKKSESQGPKEDGQTERIRVESVEIYQPGCNDQSFMGVVGNREIHQGFITLFDIEVEETHDYFAEGILVHNCHIFGDEWGQCATVLRHTSAPMRIGFTATAPEEEHIRVVLEGMMGPMIDQVTYQEGRDKGLLAEPQIELLPVTVNSSIDLLKNYNDIYDAGIVNNRSRNLDVLRKAKELNRRGLTVIIFVNMLEHGDILVNTARLLDLEVYFIEGLTDATARTAVKKMIERGEAMCVISSKVWREGLNIPSLGAVILAGGGKSETSTLQFIGRALRRTNDKDEAVVVDFLDPYKYLAEHAIQRITTYIVKGWL